MPRELPGWLSGPIEDWTQTMKRPADLPDYDSPPVNEVVIGIQFTRTAITGAHVGLFWEGIRNEFPTAVEQPPLDPQIEYFEPQRFFLPSIGIAAWPGTRHWLISEDHVHLVQIQADRLLYNWRRGPANAAYPHFEALYEKFHGIADAWLDYLNKIGQPISLTQWEVTYINHIFSTDVPPRFGEILTFWGSELERAMGGHAEAGRMEAQRILKEADGVPWARMYVNVGTGIRPDQSRIISFELTVRGPPENENPWGRMQDQLFKARRHIVTAFDVLTTPKMHATWGKRN
jgi:uncharacterized protein (TIGR04255 family)